MLLSDCSDEVGDRDSKGDGESELGELEQEEESGSGSVWVGVVEFFFGSVWVSTEQDFAVGLVYVDLVLFWGACDGGQGPRKGGKSSWGWRGAETRFQLLSGLRGG